jgi:hypothetical protein
MVEHFDLDDSGQLDTQAEIEAVPCGAWLAVDASYQRGRLGIPLTRFYGFDSGTWVNGALGCDFRMREVALERLRACGVR